MTVQTNQNRRRAALHNLGCKVNAYELESARELLELAGYEIVPFAPGADLYVINTCTVTNIADRKSRQMLHRARQMNPDALVIAMGCYAQIHGKDLEVDPTIDVIIGNNRRAELLQVIADYERSGKKQILRDDLTQERRYEKITVHAAGERTRVNIKVQDGCDSFCSYCIIPYARGRVRSRAVADVLSEVRDLAQSGTREVVITGIHVCSYGKDFDDGTGLLDLLRAINAVEGIRRIRLGSLEPGYLSEDVIRGLAAVEKLCPHFHLSLQSGCDETLRRMNRRYTSGEFLAVCDALRAAFPDPALTTDVIVGFPGETDAEFAASLDTIRRAAFFDMHVFPYSRRAGTKAADMPGQIAEQIKKERSAILRDLADERRADYLSRAVGTEEEVLFEERTDRADGQYLTGHTARYRRVMIPEGMAQTGEIRQVRIEGVIDGEALRGSL